jgi:hypothetical protein
MTSEYATMLQKVETSGMVEPALESCNFHVKWTNRYLFAALDSLYSDIDSVYRSCSMPFHCL